MLAVGGGKGLQYMVGEARGKELQGEKDEHQQKAEQMMYWATSPEPVRSGGIRRRRRRRRRGRSSRSRQAVGQSWVRCAHPPTARRLGGQLGCEGGQHNPCWDQAGQVEAGGDGGEACSQLSNQPGTGNISRWRGSKTG